MLSLKSKKISLGILAALVSIDWFVGLPETSSFNAADSFNPGHSKPHLPTLRIVPSPMLASGYLFNFVDKGNSASPFHELQTLAFTTPLQIGLVQLSKREPVQQSMSAVYENLSDQIIREAPVPVLLSNTDTDTDSKESIANVKPETLPTQTRETRVRADTPQAANLLKLLALYSMLHR